jgi:protein SCO1/2
LSRLPSAILAVILFVAAAVHHAGAGYLPVIEHAPAFELVDQNGHAVNSAELKGSVVLLAFMYTHCSTVCPMVTERMGAIATQLGGSGAPGKSIRLVSISFDPARDTPAWLATYSRSVGADPRWLFLTGSREQIASVLDGYDFHVTRLPSGDFDHVSRVYLIDASGNIRQIYSVSFLDPPRVVRDVDSLFAEQGATNQATNQVNSQ